MDDDMSIESMLVESETLLPELDQQQAAGTQDDASDKISCLTDPTSPNLVFTLPQLQQAAPHDFGQGNDESHEYFNEDPFMNPAIDEHEWQVTETSKKVQSHILIIFLNMSYSRGISKTRRLSPESPCRISTRTIYYYVEIENL